MLLKLLLLVEYPLADFDFDGIAAIPSTRNVKVRFFLCEFDLFICCSNNESRKRRRLLLLFRLRSPLNILSGSLLMPGIDDILIIPDDDFVDDICCCGDIVAFGD